MMPNPTDLGRLLTIPALCRMTGLGYKFIVREIREGRLQATRAANGWHRIGWADFDENGSADLLIANQVGDNVSVLLPEPLQPVLAGAVVTTLVWIRRRSALSARRVGAPG